MKARLRAAAKKKEVVPASLKPDERVNPAAGTEDNDQIVFRGGRLKHQGRHRKER